MEHSERGAISRALEALDKIDWKLDIQDHEGIGRIAGHVGEAKGRLDYLLNPKGALDAAVERPSQN